MQNVMNRRWLLAAYPEGMPTLENWTLDSQTVPDPGPGQILVKAKWLSVDPYMRGRMSPSANYTKGVAIGEAYIATATAAGDFPRVVLGVAIMCVLVTLFNRLLWRPLYAFGERRLRLG